MAVFSGVDDWF